jgi:hypothetical protein
MGDDERAPDRAMQQRHLLPRRPSDRVVVGLLLAGVVPYALGGAEQPWGLWLLAPGAVAALWQKVAGHVLAWRSEGVERAFVMESAAICFYVVVAGCVLAGVAQAAGLVDHVDAFWVVIGALFADTLVRDRRGNRYA